MLDFPFQQQARDFGSSKPTDRLAELFAQGDWFTDRDSNAYQLPTFLGNHDMGHIGMFLRDDNAGAPEGELLARDRLVHALMYLARGNPVIYFGDEQGFTGAGNDQAARQDMFPSQDSEYNNLDDDGVDPNNGQNLSDGGKNDNIGSDVTPAADNFDRRHPLYRTIATSRGCGATTRRSPTARSRRATPRPQAGIFAFSRTDAGARSSTWSRSTTPPARSPPTSRRTRRGCASSASGARARSGCAQGATRPSSSRSTACRPWSTARPASCGVGGRPQATLKVAPEVSGRPEVAAEVGGDLYQVSFYLSTEGGTPVPLGTDDNAPYRVYPDLSAFSPGRESTCSRWSRTTRATSRGPAATHRGDAAGRRRRDATLHYRRADGNYADWGLHLWGDAIAEGVGTTWDKPRAPTRTDDFGLVFEIPLADAAASVNYIIHKPSGDSVPDSREPGGDRSFVPAVNREVWVVAGDPTIHPSEP